ncbi:MAG: hypothetical protein H6579_09845 [Chitinophagales bacterium]|nr:hypothetical protein [Chitinophagales bacterium]
MNKDIVSQLIQTFTAKEKRQLAKYLQIYEEENYINYPFAIYKAYLSIDQFKEKEFTRKSGCKSISHFRKEKSILKYRILDYLRIFAANHNNILAEWRKQIDYGAILKDKGELFWLEGLKILKRTMDESYQQYSSTYSFAAYEEASEMFHILMAKNQTDVLSMIQIQEASNSNLNQDFNVFDYYKRVSIKLNRSSFIKSKNEEELLELLQNDALFTFDTNLFHSNGTKYIHLLSICLIATIVETRNDFLLEKSNEFKKLYKSFPPNSWYNTFFFQIAYYIAYSNFLIATNRITELRNHLAEWYEFLMASFPKIEDQALYWSRYYHSYYTLCCHNPHIENEIIRKLEKHIFFFEQRTPAKISLQFRIILIRFYILNQSYAFALRSCEETIAMHENDSSVFDTKNITKLVQLACLFRLMIEEKSIADRMQEIETLAASYYRHFRSLEKEYYTFETKFCSFFSTLSVKYNKDLKNELAKFKGAIEKVDRSDKYNFLSKLSNHYFDFYAWIDDCIAILK